MTRRDDSGLIDLNALLKDMASSAPPPNESPERHQGACDPLATVPSDLYLLTMRLSAADSAPAPAPGRESVAGSLLPARREGRTRLAITVALVAVLACGGTAIGLTQSGAATSGPTSLPVPAHERAPALAVAQQAPCDPSAMPNRTPATMPPSTSSRPEPATLARPHRAAVNKTKTGELAKPASSAPSQAPTATTTEAALVAAAAAAAPASPSTEAAAPAAAAAAAAPASPSTEAAATAEPSAPAAPPRAEEPMTLEEAMRSAVTGKKVQASATRPDVARGSEGNATSGELQ